MPAFSMQAFRAAGSGTTQRARGARAHSSHLAPTAPTSGTRAGGTAYGSDPGNLQREAQSRHCRREGLAVRPSVHSSPTSLRGTRASEPHQGAPTHSWEKDTNTSSKVTFPAIMGRAVCEQSPSQGSHLPHRTPLTIPSPSSSSQLRGNTSTRCHICLLSSGSR